MASAAVHNVLRCRVMQGASNARTFEREEFPLLDLPAEIIYDSIIPKLHFSDKAALASTCSGLRATCNASVTSIQLASREHTSACLGNAMGIQRFSKFSELRLVCNYGNGLARCALKRWGAMVPMTQTFLDCMQWVSPPCYAPVPKTQTQRDTSTLPCSGLAALLPAACGQLQQVRVLHLDTREACHTRCADMCSKCLRLLGEVADEDAGEARQCRAIGRAGKIRGNWLWGQCCALYWGARHHVVLAQLYTFYITLQEFNRRQFWGAAYVSHHGPG